MKVQAVETEDEWPSALIDSLTEDNWPLTFDNKVKVNAICHGRTNGIRPMEGPLEEGEEQEGDTETKTSDHCLWPSKQPSATSAKDLWPSGKKTSDVPVELKERAVEPNSVKKVFGSSGGESRKDCRGATSDAFVSSFFGYLDGKMVKYAELELARST
ncbi:hypothetical protein AXG93_3912s1040 [Marchantia polymorpha subsp. ruderalis]|uniref:Uncharacterized protein n=1 Tax=Marchantia polymorpha subsp. ruderalis TaxID=1480154 RepID=A0A176VYB6_MARPO|nr:hypothetical protein AXG93_3912s1040 [Marchantia polymorpha subsp. ruderalis]